jgi:hypothetical protein
VRNLLGIDARGIQKRPHPIEVPMARVTAGRSTLVALAPLGLVMAGCGPRIEFPEPGPPPPADIVTTHSANVARTERATPTQRAAAAPTPVGVRYLGSAGFLIRRKDTVVMTAPLFTNPFPLAHLSSVTASPKLIKAFVDDVNEVADGAAGKDFEADLKAVAVVLSGHAHYDHLMDVPQVAQDYMSVNKPFIVSNTTGKRLMAPFNLPNVVALNEPGANFVDSRDAAHCAGSGCDMPDEAGKWWPSDQGTATSKVRVYAVSSDHPPQLFGILFFPGCQKTAFTRPPTKFDDWKMGEVMAFMIDLLDGSGGVAFRIYYEDAPLPPCRSAPFEKLITDGHDVDLAILCAGNFSEVPGAETIVKRLRAQNVILSHWEWFFDEKAYRKRFIFELPPPNSVKEYRGLVLQQLAGVSHPEEHISVPYPGVRLTY